MKKSLAIAVLILSCSVGLKAQEKSTVMPEAPKAQPAQQTSNYPPAQESRVEPVHQNTYGQVNNQPSQNNTVTGGVPMQTYTSHTASTDKGKSDKKECEIKDDRTKSTLVDTVAEKLPYAQADSKAGNRYLYKCPKCGREFRSGDYCTFDGTLLIREHVDASKEAAPPAN